jgi:hypothetical protein
MQVIIYPLITYLLDLLISWSFTMCHADSPGAGVHSVYHSYLLVPRLCKYRKYWLPYHIFTWSSDHLISWSFTWFGTRAMQTARGRSTFCAVFSAEPKYVYIKKYGSRDCYIKKIVGHHFLTYIVCYTVHVHYYYRGILMQNSQPLD